MNYNLIFSYLIPKQLMPVLVQRIDNLFCRSANVDNLQIAGSNAH